MFKEKGKMNKVLILIGSLVNLLFSLMHLTLGKALNWSETLSCLTLGNRATIYTLNVHLAFTCLIFAYVSLFHRKEMLTTGIGRAMTAAIGLCYLLRAVNQVIYNGLSAPGTLFGVILFLLVSLLYMIPVLGKRPVTPLPTVS
jgi:hypothetical protein